MWLLFSLQLPDASITHHTLFCNELEDLLDLLNCVVENEYNLLSACLIDRGQRMELPIDAFDGEPIGLRLRTLQAQYQTVLS